MQVHKCDKCGKYFDQKIIVGKYLLATITHPDDFLELCPECQLQLERWFKEGEEDG